MIRRILFSALFVGLALSAVAQRGGPPPRPGGPGPGRPAGDPEAVRLLRFAAQADMKLRYFGTRVTIVRLESDSAKNIEKIWKDGPRMRIEFEAGSANFGQVIVNDGKKRYHYFPSANEIQVKPAPFDPPFRRFAELGGGQRGFRLTIDGSATIAGIAAKTVSLRDRFDNAVGTLWIDPKSGMILKRENYDPTGRLVGSFEFKSVDLTPNFQPGDFEIKRKGATFVSTFQVLKDRAREASVPPLMLDPGTGFALDAIRVIGDSPKILVQSYTSDQGRVTVFLSSQAVNPDRLSRLAKGRVNVVVRKIRGSNAVFVSEVDLNELNRLADHLSEVPKGN